MTWKLYSVQTDGWKEEIKMLCSTSHFPMSGRQKKSSKEVTRNVASKHALTLCSGHICPLITHFDASLLS
jgi:hypothetical protein